MLGYISKFLLGVLTSFYFFPFEFTFLPGYNTKKLMAAFSLVLWGINLVKRRVFTTDKNLFTVSIFAIIVSLAGLFSVIFNNTNDYTYATYIMSMWVWLGASYVVVNAIKAHHKTVSVDLVCHYLIGVCVAQCIVAILIDNSVLIKGIVDRYVATTGFIDQSDLANKDRLYGIGCALDVAGTRFAAVLLMISALIGKYKGEKIVRLYLYLISFVVIAIIGNMIARTTTIGLILTLLYMILKAYPYDLKISINSTIVIKHILIIAIIIFPIVCSLYNNSPALREDIRFAFEGFFSLAEKGEWEVSSNEKLKTMIVFPDNVKTWIIGDGYFHGPSETDPYYVGPTMRDFYMGTDVGYLRFIFYFGIIGLIAFMFFFFKCGQECAKKFHKYSILFSLFVILNYIIWFKVSTDIFLVFALFLSIDKEDNDEYEEMMDEEAAEIEG